MKIMDVVEDGVNCESTSIGAMNTAGLRTRWSCSTFLFFKRGCFLADCYVHRQGGSEVDSVPSGAVFQPVGVAVQELFVFFDYFSAT